MGKGTILQQKGISVCQKGGWGVGGGGHAITTEVKHGVTESAKGVECRSEECWDGDEIVKTYAH